MKHFKTLIFSLSIFTNFNYLVAVQPEHNPSCVHVTNNNIQNTTLVLDVTQVPVAIGKLYDTGQKHINKRYQDLVTWLKNHKYIFIGIFAASTYSAIMYQLILGKKILSDPLAWANWYGDTSLTDLINKPTNLISRELHQALLDKYSDSTTADVMAPIILFNYALNREFKILNNFCLINKKLAVMRMQNICLTSNDELKQAQDKLSRLVYLKKVINESIQISLAR